MNRVFYFPENHIFNKTIKFKPILLVSILSIIGCIENKEKINNEVEKLYLAKSNSTDSLLKIELESIAVEDQTLRFLLPDVTKRFGSPSKEEKYIWSLIHRQDSICLKKITEILKVHGWLGKSRVGIKANQAIWLVIQHADLEVQERYLPLLKKSTESGESEKWHLAFLEDRILMRKEQRQIYGTQAIWDATCEKMSIYPIEDVANVNKRRKSIGLQSIEEYAKQNGYIFKP